MNSKGLTTAEALERAKQGKNVLTQGKKKSLFSVIAEQFASPLLLLLGFAGKSLTNAVIACGIFFALWLAYTVFLFRRKIFKKRGFAPVQTWSEEQ